MRRTLGPTLVCGVCLACSPVLPEVPADGSGRGTTTGSATTSSGDLLTATAGTMGSADGTMGSAQSTADPTADPTSGSTSGGSDSEQTGDSGRGGSTTGVEFFPETCQQVLDADPGALDGEHMLFVAGDAVMPWSAYCHDMAGTPREYLTLPAGGPDNFSQYTAGGASIGTDVRTEYARLRIDPVTLEVEPNDAQFASSTGSLQHDGATTVAQMPYGVAMSCDFGPSGVASIDLTGTPFAVDVDFCQSGNNASGTASSMDGGRTVAITGGGGCGWTAFGNPCPYNPHEGIPGTLPLRYQP